MMKKYIHIASLVVLLSSGSAGAVTDKLVTIKGIGCGADGICFANVTPPVSYSGAGACSNPNQVRWDGTSTEGKNFTAAAMTAKAGGITVNIGTNDGSCNGDFPELNFITVQ